MYAVSVWDTEEHARVSLGGDLKTIAQ